MRVLSMHLNCLALSISSLRWFLLNILYHCRIEDVGKPKAEVAAKRVMERVSGVEIVPHFCRIEDKELEFYSRFHIIALGLDSIEARSYINAVACSFLGWYLNLLNFNLSHIPIPMFAFVLLKLLFKFSCLCALISMPIFDMHFECVYLILQSNVSHG